MKTEKTLILFCCLVVLFQTSLHAQFLRADSLHIGNITTASVDLFGNLYISDQQGNILKIEPGPVHIIRYSGRQTFGYDKIDAKSFNKIAVFSKDLQAIRFFDKNLNPLSELPLGSGLASSATCFCMSSDNKIWIFDETEPGLKKINPVTGRVVLDIDCNPVLNSGQVNISDMKEYKNRLYMLDGNDNVYVFNLMGNLLKTFRDPGTDILQFHDDYLISVTSDRLIFCNLDNDSRSQKSFNHANIHGQFLFSEKYIYEISKNIIIRPVGEGFYKINF